MEYFFCTSARSGALRSLAMAETLLESRDLLGSRSFAERARNADPSLSGADQILAIVDTLLGAERRFPDNLPDWLAVLHLTPLVGLDRGVVSQQFRRLRYLLDPRRNRSPFAEEAFRLIHVAYSSLFSPITVSDVEDPGLNSPPLLLQLLPDPLPARPHDTFHLFGCEVGGANSAQVQPKVEPVDGIAGSTRETRNFMG